MGVVNISLTGRRAPLITNQFVGHVDNPSYLLTAVDIHLSLSTPANAWGDYGSLPGGFGRVEAGPPGSSGCWRRDRAMPRPAPFGSRVQARPSSGCHASRCGPRHRVAVAQAGRLGSLRLGVGAGHAFDYFESDTSVDARNVGVEGHSSYGKAIVIAWEWAGRSRDQVIRRGRRRGSSSRTSHQPANSTGWPATS